MRILRERVPLDVKEKLVKLVNELIDRESKIKALRFRRKKLKRGALVRRDLSCEIKASEKSLKQLYRDYKSMLRRAKKYEERLASKRAQAFWIMGVAIALLALLAVCSVFHNEINGFFSAIF